MTQTQGTLIYIEKDNIMEAEFMSRNFVNPEIKHKVYLNALGAELVGKYLESEGFDIANTHNLHSISKILEDIDISDILLPNIHIDVRVIFDKNQIFIPKSHFNLQIVPDIYAVIKIDDDFKEVEFLGYIKSSDIDKTNQNSDYYFVPEKDLKPAHTLTKFIKDFPGKTAVSLSEEDFLRGRELSVSLSDHNITLDEKRELLQLLLMDSSLRESVIEFDNFETLSYNAAPELANLPIEFAATTVETNINNEKIIEDDIQTTIEEDDDELIIDELEAETDELAVNNSEESELEIEEVQEIDEDLNEQIENISLDEVETLSEESDEIEQVQDIAEEEVETSFEESDEIEQVEDIAEEEVETSFEVSDEIKQVQDIAAEEVETSFEVSDEIKQVEDIATEEVETSFEVSDEIKQVQDIAAGEIEIPLETSILDLENSDLGDDMLDSDLIDENITLPEENLLQKEPEIESLEETETQLFETPALNIENSVQENILQEPTLAPLPEINLSVDAILDQTIASIGQNVIKTTAETTTAAAAAITGAVETGATKVIGDEVESEDSDNELEQEDKNEETTSEVTEKINSEVSDEAIKLASVSGEMIDNVVDKNIAQQQKRLDKIDYAKTDIAPDTTEIPEHIQALGTLSTSKMEANLEAENSGEFDSPTDLSQLNSVETYEEEVFEQETIDIGEMETIETEEFKENTDEIVNLAEITDIDSPTKPLKDIQDLNEPEIEGMDLPDLSSYTINDDGTSSIDNFNLDLDLGNSQSEENLVDIGMKMNLNEISLDDNDPYKIQEIEDNHDHLNELPPMNDFSQSLDETTENTTIEDTDKLNEIDYENEILDSEFDEISLDDFDNFTTEKEEITEVSDNTEPTEFETLETIENKTEEQEILEEDWLEDTNYDNIENIETESIENVNEEELISEPQDNNMVQEVLAIENSTVISDRTFKTGEIPIDINSVQQPELENAESLESIYNPNAKIPGEGLLQTPGTMGAKQNKSGLGIGLGIAGTLITLALVGAIGFGAAKLFKGPSTETPQPITDDNLPATDTNISEENTLKIDPNNVVNMDENQNALASTTQNATEQKSAAKTTQAPVKKKMAPTSFIEVKKLTWEVPDYISYNTQFKQYFQSIGKSLKLSLGSDLLLATDPIFSNQVRVSVTFEKDGTFKNSQIIVSSGSTQVDKIVLQTVNDTLKAVKAPHSVGNDENTTVILKLYF